MQPSASQPDTSLPSNTVKRTVSRKPNDEARGQKYLTRDEVLLIAKAARKGKRNGLRDELMILMAYEHGLRVSELVGLRWQQLNLNTAELSVQRVKGSVDGTHPIQGETLRRIRAYKRDCGDPVQGFIFQSERGAPISVDGFRRMFGRVSKQALGVQWNPHALRHACGVHLINSGTDIRTIQAYMGHANMQNTVVYTTLTGKPFERLTF